MQESGLGHPVGGKRPVWFSAAGLTYPDPKDRNNSMRIYISRNNTQYIQFACECTQVAFVLHMLGHIGDTYNHTIMLPM